MKLIITPEMATEWLKGNTHNRKLHEDRVKDYVRDMVAGHWPYNGESIKIAEDGTIIDGQHRLVAIVLANVAIETEVIADLPMGVQTTIDTGRVRSVSDTFALQGEVYTRNLAAIAKRAWQWEEKNYRFGSRPTPTSSEVREMLERYPSLRRSAEMGQRIAYAFKPARASVLGLVHHLFLQLDPDDTAVFFAAMETGADLGQGHPVLALRNRMTQDKLQQRAIPFHVSVGCCVRTWNALRKGENMTIVKMTTDSAMPQPI